MSISLFFNLSFDLGGLSLILFVVWFFVNFNNSKAAFKWFSLSILTLLASIIILSYGDTKLAKVRYSLPSQNQTDILNLRQDISNLKGKESHKATGNAKVPSRIVNSTDNQIVKEAVTKHQHHVNLVAKVIKPSDPVTVRGVHSSQIYKVHGKHNQVTAGEFIIIKGVATNVKNNTIRIKATSIERQPNS